MGQTVTIDEDTMITLGIAAIGIINGWTLWLVQAAKKERSELKSELDAQRKDLADFKIEVSRNHVTVTMLQQMEGRLGEALRSVNESIRGLGDRVDRVFEKREHD